VNTEPGGRRLVRHLRLGLGGPGGSLSTSHHCTSWGSEAPALGSRSRGLGKPGDPGPWGSGSTFTPRNKQLWEEDI